jgi:hypothetical protein
MANTTTHSEAIIAAKITRTNFSLISADRIGTRSTREYYTVSPMGNPIPQVAGCCIGREVFFDVRNGEEVGASLKFDVQGMR